MATFILEEAERTLANILQTNNPKLQRVAFFAIAEYYTRLLFSKAVIKEGQVENLTTLKLHTEQFLNYLVEVAIFNKSELQSIIRSLLNSKLEKLSDPVTKNLDVSQTLGWKCLNDVLGISDTYSSNDIFAINQNFPTYCAAYEAFGHLVQSQVLGKRVECFAEEGANND